MDPVVAAGIIGAGAAVVSSFLTGLLLIGSARMQIKSAAEVARRTFISERQADTYVSVCNQISRVQAWASIAAENALGRQSHLAPVKTINEDDWFELQGRLRVFGSRIVRDEFDMVMNAAHSLRVLEASTLQGNRADENDVATATATISLHAARVRTAVSAEVGPLYDLLDLRPIRWWQIRRRMDRRKVLTQQEEGNGTT